MSIAKKVHITNLHLYPFVIWSSVSLSIVDPRGCVSLCNKIRTLQQNEGVYK